MDLSVLSRQGGFAAGNPFVPTCFLWKFPRREWSIWKPPKQTEADNDTNEAVQEEHPLDPKETSQSIHLLETGRDETNDGGRYLGCCEVLAYPFPGSGWRIEECQVVSHARPHACNHNTEQNTEETVITVSCC